MRRTRTQEVERLYDAHAQALYAFLAYRTGDPVMAEDLVSDTFERVLVARKPFDPRKSSEKTWLYTIALNLLRDLARSQAAEGRAIARISQDTTRGNGHGNGFDAVETRQVILAAMSALSVEEREVLALRYGADLSLAEIAKVVGKPRSTVESRVYKGLKHLRAELFERDAKRDWTSAALG